MKKDSLIYIRDILHSIDLIQMYTKDVSFSEFEKSYDIQDKVHRRLEIIAEAAKKLSEEIRNRYPQVPWKSIIGLRNIIIHTYDEINETEVWEIVKNNLPQTKQQFVQIKNELEQ